MTHHTTTAQAVPIDPSTIEHFADHIRAWGRAENTVKAYSADLRRLLADRPDLTAENFSDTAAAWLTEHRDAWQPATVNRRLATFNQFAAYLGVPGLQNYRRPRSSDQARRGVSMEVVLDTLAKLRAMDGLTGLTISEVRDSYALVALCGAAGLRISEAVEVTFDDFSTPDGDTIPLTVHGKGGKVRVVPMPMLHYRHLLGFTSWKLHNVGKVDEARWIVRRAFRLCGYDKVESHQLRAAFATAAFDACHDIVLVQRLLGHSSPTITQRYIRTRYEAGAAVVASLGAES